MEYNILNTTSLIIIMNKTEPCRLIGGSETYFIQLLLGILSLSSLYFKRKREYPQRQWSVFKYDVSKQIIGMGFAHIINISIAILFNDKFNMDDECRWYFLNFFIDVTFGIFFNYLLLKHSSKYFKRKNFKALTPGEYLPGNSCYNKSFIMQLGVWLFIILLSKAIVLSIILIPFKHQLDDFGRWFLGPVSHNNTLELVIVMIILPILFNIIQFWVQDNILKGKRHYIDSCLIPTDNLECVEKNNEVTQEHGYAQL